MQRDDDTNSRANRVVIMGLAVCTLVVFGCRSTQASPRGERLCPSEGRTASSELVLALAELRLLVPDYEDIQPMLEKLDSRDMQGLADLGSRLECGPLALFSHHPDGPCRLVGSSRWIDDNASALALRDKVETLILRIRNAAERVKRSEVYEFL